MKKRNINVPVKYLKKRWNSRYSLNMNSIERKAFNYLKSKDVNIDVIWSKWNGYPDFIDDEDIGYEIKKLNGKNGVIFSKLQWDNFLDRDWVLIFKSDELEPYIICSMKDLRSNKVKKIKVHIVNK